MEKQEMYCYQHQNNNALGMCKYCQKAVCASCAKDTGKGLVCSANCEQELSEINQIMDRSKLIYNINKKSKLPASGVLFHLFFGLMFSSFGLIPLAKGDEPSWFLVIMGSGFLLFGILVYLRTRKLNLNC